MAVRLLFEALARPVTLVGGDVGSALLASSIFLALVAFVQATALRFETARTYRWIAVNIAGIGGVAVLLFALRGLPAITAHTLYDSAWSGNATNVALTTAVYGLSGAITSEGIIWLLHPQPSRANAPLELNHGTAPP